LEDSLKRALVTLLSSPFLIVADIGLLAGLALIAFGVFHVGWQAGSPTFVGLMLIGFSGSLILPALIDATTPEFPLPPNGAPPDGGNRLPPAQEGVLSLKETERQNVIAIGRREHVARA
jgi:hypothetical protein